METDKELFYSELINSILEHENLPKHKLNVLKNDLSKKYNMNRIVKNTQILAYAENDEIRYELIKRLDIKPIRELSGVTVLALFAKPHKCPHGKCIYCPGGVDSEFGNTPQSYTGLEPAALRAVRNDYDPYLQVFNRLEHYVANGHVPDKLELIFMGGTFPSLNKQYRDEFVYYVYKAINDFAQMFIFIDSSMKKRVDYEKFNEFFEMKQDINSSNRETSLKAKMLDLKYLNVKEDFLDYKSEIKKNETGLIRSIGLTIESKPEWALADNAYEMLKYGATRFEIGVQTLNDDILRKINRGHTSYDIKRCFLELKDMCFKINAHMMLNLPYSSEKDDIDSMRELFENEAFRPDMLKIYPCLVIKGTLLFDMYKRGEFVPLDTFKMAELISKIVPFFPDYVRVMRIQRDVPTPVIEAGVKNSNLRNYVDELLIKKNIKSNDIRAREVGFALLSGKSIKDDFVIKTLKYKSSGGDEFFISVVNSDNLIIGFLRLRFPFKIGLMSHIDDKTAMIRELHVYGNTVCVGNESQSFQHKGWGKKLLQYAENICTDNGYEKIIVISGVGVREYYKKNGYFFDEPYMVKNLK